MVKYHIIGPASSCEALASLNFGVRDLLEVFLNLLERRRNREQAFAAH